MANALYDKGRNRFARGEIAWKSAGGDTVRMFLLASALYTPDLAGHEFLTDIPEAARKGNNGSNARIDAPQLVLLDPVSGICDAQDVTFAPIPPGLNLGYSVIFKDSGADATSPLILIIDSGAGLPLLTNGAPIVFRWDDGANKIFKL